MRKITESDNGKNRNGSVLRKNVGRENIADETQRLVDHNLHQNYFIVGSCNMENFNYSGKVSQFKFYFELVPDEILL